MEISIWYSVDNRILFIITSFIIGNKKSISQAHTELNSFVKKYKTAFDDTTVTGIKLIPLNPVIGINHINYHRVDRLGQISITAHIRNFIYDFNKEIREVENGI